MTPAATQAGTIAVIGGFAPSLLLFRAPLLQAMVARNHRVIALAADGTPEITERLAALGVEFEPLAIERAGRDPLADARTLANLASRLRALRPEVVFAYTFKPVIYGLLAGRVARARRYAMITGLGYTFMGQDRWRRRVLRRGVSLALRAALSDAAGLFVQNGDDLRELHAAGAIPRLLPTHIVRGSGVDLAHYAQAPQFGGPPTFLFIGRLLREKGFEDFVELARRVRQRRPDVRFRAIGWVDPNPASVSAAEVARWTAAGIIEYLGEVPDVRPYLAEAHVLVLPSYREGTPRSVLEAMAMGRPVIVTDVPGCRETIVDGEHGFFVPPRDPDALVTAAERFLASPSLLATMGQRARARVEQLYDAHAVAKSMVDEMQL